jgi:ESCRT-II complex subunit VPS22
MARRQVGFGALERSKTSTQQYAELSTSLTTQSVSELTTQLTAFQSLLSQFSQQHALEIRSNPSFRSEFAKMCTAIGVDPLVASTRRTAAGRGGRQWVKDGLAGWGMLGVGEFWIGVATRVVGVCRRTRGENGGFISVEEVRRILVGEDRKARRKDVVEISEYPSSSPCSELPPCP